MTGFRNVWLAIAVLVSASPDARAQSYPSQPVRIVVPFSAGSITDGLARVIGEKLGEVWKQQVLIENRPGVPGTTSVAKAAPDGLTLMLTSNGHTVAGVLNKNLPFDPVADFAGITQVASVPAGFFVPPDLPANNIREFIALAKAKPGALNFSSAGTASQSYLGGELFKQLAKIDIVHVPHKGAPEAMTSIIRGDTQLFLSGVSLALDLVETKRVKIIAVSTGKRTEVLPDVPTVSESGLPDYVYDSWFGIMAPAATPRAIVNKANADIVHILQLPDVKERLSKQGVVVATQSPEQYDALIKSDTERYTKTLRDAGVGPQ